MGKSCNKNQPNWDFKWSRDEGLKIDRGKAKKKNQNEIKVDTVKLDFVPVQMVVQVRGGMDS